MRSAMTRRMPRQSRRSTVSSGFFSVVPVALASSNSGDSFSFARTNRPAATSTALTRNGTRHFQSPSRFALKKNIPLDRAMPSGLPAWGIAANMPRRTPGPGSS